MSLFRKIPLTKDEFGASVTIVARERVYVMNEDEWGELLLIWGSGFRVYVSRRLNDDSAIAKWEEKSRELQKEFEETWKDIVTPLIDIDILPFSLWAYFRSVLSLLAWAELRSLPNCIVENSGRCRAVIYDGAFAVYEHSIKQVHHETYTKMVIIDLPVVRKLLMGMKRNGLILPYVQHLQEGWTHIT